VKIGAHLVLYIERQNHHNDQSAFSPKATLKDFASANPVA
jgi:hypothetical protein